MLNGLDLFSGIGGLSIALSEWVTPIAYCENERYAQSVLLSRMWDGTLASAPIWDDIRTLSANGFAANEIDIIYGGFPCQDISAAGRGEGLDGERSGLYWQLHRLVQEANPRFVFLENVPAIRTRGLGIVAQSLTELGYDLRWTVVSAAEVGAPHIRKRWFMLAHSNGKLLRVKPGRRKSKRQSEAIVGHHGEKEYVADTKGQRSGGGFCENESQQDGDIPANGGAALANPARGGQPVFGGPQESEGRHALRGNLPPERWIDQCSWAIEPNVGRVANGVSRRVDRLRGLGNAVVPLQARTAFTRLLGIE